MSSYLEYYGLIEEEGRGASGGLDPVNWERAQEDFLKEDNLTYNFPDKLKKIYNEGLPESLDKEIVDFLNNKLWGDEEFVSSNKGFVQPWRENAFIFYAGGNVNVKHGDPGNSYFVEDKLSDNEIVLLGHTHTAAAYQLSTASESEKWTGLFLRNHYSEKRGEDIIEVCDSGIPSDVDIGFYEKILSKKNSKVPNIVVGEQFVTFYKGNVESVYDIDTGKKVGTDIKYTQEALDYLKSDGSNPDVYPMKIFEVKGLTAVELVGDNGSTFYDIFGNKTGGTGGSQKELRKVSGGIKVSSQGYISLEY